MSDFKSKLPDLKEIGAMTGRLFRDIRNSVSEIITDYKEKHPTPEPGEKASEETTVEVKETKVTVKTEAKKPAPAPKAAAPKKAEKVVVEKVVAVEEPEEITHCDDPLEVTPGAPVDDVEDKEK